MSNTKRQTENKGNSLFQDPPTFKYPNLWVQIFIHQPTPPLWYKDTTQSQVAPYTDWSLANLTMTPCDVITLG